MLLHTNTNIFFDRCVWRSRKENFTGISISDKKLKESVISSHEIKMKYFHISVTRIEKSVVLKLLFKLDLILTKVIKKMQLIYQLNI